MPQKDDRPEIRTGAALLCAALSLVLHAGILSLLLPTPREVWHTGALQRERTRTVQVLRMKKTAPPAVSEGKNKGPKKDIPFTKTSADTPQAQPEHADFQGARNTRAASDSAAADLRTMEKTPALQGRKRDKEEEIVSFNQERQEGELTGEGKNPTAPTPEENTRTELDTSPIAEQQDTKREKGEREGSNPSQENRKAILTAAPFNKAPDGELRLSDNADETRDKLTSDTPPQKATRRRYYDPALSAEAQRPGFRTEERRTRSSGRFIFGKGAALNVAATPRGVYEADIYRRIARLWYAACDDHRGDIIPGQLTISLRLNRRGHLVNMHLMSRSGASVSQQSFTFAAIRRAALPPMPAEVQAEIVGELMELIFTFHFD